MKPQELAPDARPRQSSSKSNELWYSRLTVTKADSKGGERHKKAKPPQGGGLNGGAQKPRSANFSISSAVDLVLPPPCPFDQEKTHRCEQVKCVLVWPIKLHWTSPGCTPNQTGSDSLPRDERRTRALEKQNPARR